MTITTEMAESAIKTARDNLPDSTPTSYLPQGSSTLRFYLERNEADKIVWIKEVQVFQYRGVGAFPADDEFCKDLHRRAEAHCQHLPHDKRWSWQWKPKRMGVIKACFFKLPQDADPKYIIVDEPRIVLLNARALDAFHTFMSGLEPGVVIDQFDPDKKARGLLVSHSGGPSGATGIGWDFDDYELPEPKTLDGALLPPLAKCWVQPGASPSHSQRQIMEDDLKVKIMKSTQEYHSNTISPSA